MLALNSLIALVDCQSCVRTAVPPFHGQILFFYSNIMLPTAFTVTAL